VGLLEAYLIDFKALKSGVSDFSFAEQVVDFGVSVVKVSVADSEVAEELRFLDVSPLHSYFTVAEV
jgi:hypothetical protein